MAARIEYKLIHNNSEKIGGELMQAGLEGWKPILMTAVVAQENVLLVFVILEHSAG
jgi:hypothetical protein